MVTTTARQIAYVSCAYHRVYPSGAGFPEPELALAQAIADKDPLAFGIRHVAELFGMTGYGAPLDPAIFAGDRDAFERLRPLYEQLAVKAASGVSLVSIDDARTFGSLIYLKGAGTPLLYETHRNIDRAAVDTATPQAIASAAPALPVFAGETLFLASAGSSNHGHFLVDDLPRIKALRVLAERYPGATIAVAMVSHSPRSDAVRQDAIALLTGGVHPVFFLESAKVHHFPRLHYATPASFHPTIKNVEALQYINDLVTDRIAPSGDGGPSRLFVDRDPADGRRLTNADEIASLLRTRGYERVFPERLSFEDQVRVFRKAASIVGCMGAAMTNTVFSPSGSELLYLAPAHWIEPFYWDLATARSHRYRVLYGASADTLPSPHRRDYAVSPSQLEALL